MNAAEQQLVIDWNADDDAPENARDAMLRLVDDHPEVWERMRFYVVFPGRCNTAHDDWLCAVRLVEESDTTGVVRNFQLNPSQLIGPLKAAVKRKLGKKWVFANGRFTGERKAITHEQPQ